MNQRRRFRPMRGLGDKARLKHIEDHLSGLSIADTPQVNAKAATIVNVVAGGGGISGRIPESQVDFDPTAGHSHNGTDSYPITPVHVTMAGTTTTLVAPAAAVTELFSVSAPVLRSKNDLTGPTQVRLIANITSNDSLTGSPELRAQYSTDGGGSWAYFAAATNAPAVSIGSANVSTTQVSAWTTMDSAARADVLIRLVTINGDAVNQITFGTIHLQFK